MNNLAELLEEELEAEAQDPCNGKTCSANEHCCEGHVCVDTDDSKFFQITKNVKKKENEDWSPICKKVVRDAKSLLQERVHFSELFAFVIHSMYAYTVWKFQDFSAIYISREINYSHFVAPKIAILMILAAVNFDFLEIFDIFIYEFFPKIKIESLQNW